MKSMMIKKWMRVTAAFTSCALFVSAGIFGGAAFFKKDVINGWHPYAYRNVHVQGVVSEESFSFEVLNQNDESATNNFFEENYAWDDPVWDDSYWSSRYFDDDAPMVLVPGSEVSSEIKLTNTGEKPFRLWFYVAQPKDWQTKINTFIGNNPYIAWNAAENDYELNQQYKASQKLLDSFTVTAEGADSIPAVFTADDIPPEEYAPEYKTKDTGAQSIVEDANLSEAVEGNEDYQQAVKAAYEAGYDDGASTNRYRTGFRYKSTYTAIAEDLVYAYDQGYQDGVYAQCYNQDPDVDVYNEGYQVGFAAGLKDNKAEKDPYTSYQDTYRGNNIYWYKLGYLYGYYDGYMQSYSINATKVVSENEVIKAYDLGYFTSGAVKEFTLSLKIPESITNLPQDMAARSGEPFTVTPLPTTPTMSEQSSAVPLVMSPVSFSSSLLRSLATINAYTHPHGFGGTVGMMDFIFVAEYAEDVMSPFVPTPDPDPTPDPTPTPTPTPTPDPPVPKTGDAAIPYVAATVVCMCSGMVCLALVFIPNRRRKEQVA